MECNVKGNWVNGEKNVPLQSMVNCLAEILVYVPEEL